MLLLLLKEMRFRWVIHLLTVCLVAFVVSLLVTQGSLNRSAEDKVNELTHKLGQGMLVVPETTDLEQFYRMKYGRETMPEDYPDRLKSSHLGKHIQVVEPRLYGNLTVKGIDVILVGQNLQFLASVKSKRDLVAVGGGLARRLNLAPGDLFEINSHKLRVFTVVDPPPKGYDMAVFAPLKTAQRILGSPGRINALYLSGCWCELDVPALAAKVESILPGTMAITVEGMAKAQIEIKRTMEQYSVIFWIVGGVLVTANIAFLLFYLIHKGKREIGLLLSIGMSPGRIVIKNIIISVVTAVAGALGGYILSIPLMSQAGRMFMRVRLSPSAEVLPWLVVVITGAALLASIIPSWYISNLDPTKLLREE
jgi:ABC-type antimicrobial peptide transport system permease subunit